MDSTMAQRRHEFGGPWTERKLEAVGKYLKFYTTALKNKRLKLLYVDAFAGTGYRASSGGGGRTRGFFPALEKDELAKGSARRALEIEPPFHEYVFIENNQGRFTALTKLKEEFPDRVPVMRFWNEEANQAIVDLCQRRDWRTARAVMFLDPYGMTVEWPTLQAIAQTKAVDLWYLFPLGVVNRLTPRRGLPRKSWANVLDRTFGEPQWRKVIYRRVRETSLIQPDRLVWRKVADNEKIANYVRSRLESIFEGGVNERTLPLYNRRHSCMFLLMFACGNPDPRAHQLAHKVATNVLKR
jgi:three-Cys-motif partner protein